MDDREPRSPVTVPMVRSRKAEGPPLVMVTAYDTPTAALVDLAGVDVILVGDSVATAVLGHRDTLSVGMAELEHHTAAVCRANPSALVVADMPWLSCDLGPKAAVSNAARLVRAGAGAVKIEGDRPKVISRLVAAGIPVMGHLGLLPQSVRAMGGYRVQGRQEAAASFLKAAAARIEAAGCFSMVLEAVPSALGAELTKAVGIPVIGIGAGPACDGQVLVLHDLLGLSPPGTHVARFVRRYAEIGSAVTAAVASFAEDVRGGSFPSAQESYA